MSRSTQRTRRNHYISQFYQRSWETKSGWLWVYRRGAKNHQEKAIRSTAAEEFLYSDELEIWFRDLENRTAIVTSKIKDGRELSREDRAVLTRFASSLARRTPMAKERTRGLLRAQIRQVREELPFELGVRAERMAKRPGEASIIFRAEKLEAERYLNDIERDVPDRFFHRNAQRQSALDQELEQMEWEFWRTDASVPLFVTSDNPAIIPPQGLRNIPRFVFPICPTICLVARGCRQDHRIASYVDIGRKRVERINRRIVQAAWREVYASEPFLKQDFVNSNIGKAVWSPPSL